jgi:transcription antitermination factor NusG
LNKWVPFQLSERGELVLESEPEILENVIKKTIDSEYFLPVYFNKVKSYENKIFLFKGYVFIKFNPEEIKKYAKLSKTQYFVGPLTTNKKLNFISDLEVSELRNKLNEMVHPVIVKGDDVKVIDGPFKSLTATVMEYYPEKQEADLEVTLKCMKILVPGIPTVCLRNIDKNKKN